MVDVTMLSVDGSHKLVKFVRIRDDGIDSQRFYCIMTIYNEVQQVCPGWLYPFCFIGSKQAVLDLPWQVVSNKHTWMTIR